MWEKRIFSEGVMRHDPAASRMAKRPKIMSAFAEPAPVTKRTIKEPRGGFMLKNVTAETITPIPYDIIKEGLKN